ncbi:MAG TPA: DUF3795 domain-containing protein [Elusimicrobiota bacterium]|nr:DUF3795 domain-containing protein [Elusimicrobiota bacterium]
MEIAADANRVAFCGLYCGACGRYLKGACPGCQQNAKAAWCAVRTCCLESHFSTCVDCKTYTEPNDCKKFNNFVSKIVGFVLRSDRRACLQQIREKGLAAHAADRTAAKQPSIRR